MEGLSLACVFSVFTQVCVESEKHDRDMVEQGCLSPGDRNTEEVIQDTFTGHSNPPTVIYFLYAHPIFSQPI